MFKCHVNVDNGRHIVHMLQIR